MKRINLIAASRERPSRMAVVLEKWLSNSKRPSNIRIIISIDLDDPTCDEYHVLLNPIAQNYGSDIIITTNPNKCTVEAINEGKKYIDGDLIIIFSDDTDCFKYWDDELNNASDNLEGKYIIKVSDGIGKTLITMPIFSREYLESFDYIYHPSYSHMFCDTELTCVANILDCVIERDNLLFEHLHYTREFHPKDRIDDKNQMTFYPGLDIFKKRLSDNFDIPHSMIKGKIPEEILQWIEETNKK